MAAAVCEHSAVIVPALVQSYETRFGGYGSGRQEKG